MTVPKLLARLAVAGLCWVAAAATQAGIPIQHWALPSGARVYLVETHAIPMVDVQLDFDAGNRRDPPRQAGLAGVVAAMVSAGVAAGPDGPALDENALSESWADLGASFGASAGTDRMSFQLRSLTYPDLLAQSVALAARQLGQPAFPAAVWERDRARMQARLKEAEARPSTAATRAFVAAVFGDHPYAAQATAESLAAIGVEDVRAAYRRGIVPCRARVTVVGAQTRAQAESLVERLLARLPSTSGCPALPAVPEVAALTQASEQRLPFDSAQAHVLIGQPGIARSDPDYFPITVGNYILGGGGFVSRLMAEVREKRGLSYSVYSLFFPGLHAGQFQIGLQTRPDQALQATAVARDVLARFVAEGPTQAELDAAKANLVGGFPLLIDSNRKLLGNVSNIAWYGLPLDYLDAWTRRVESVSVADIRRAFARVLQPERMATVVVGGTP